VARPKSDDKRDALLAAAACVIAAQGLSAPTAVIAREAGVSNGSLFTYFETKAELFNQLYLTLKTAMAAATLEGLPAKAPLREQFARAWSNWMRWGASNPGKCGRSPCSTCLMTSRRGPAPPRMRRWRRSADMVERARADGPLRDAPMGFVVALMNSLAEATMDYMVTDPAHADQHCRAGFDAMWRMLDCLLLIFLTP